MRLYPFPEPQLHLRRSATSKGHDSLYWDHQTRIIRWMGRNALRRITEVYKTSRRMPTLDELQDWLSDHCDQAIHYTKDFDKTVLDAAIFATEVYSLEEYAKRVMWASNGGKKSGWKSGARGKRPPKFTTEQLQKYEHLSIAQQAVELKCSEATVSRIRARLKAEKAAAHEAELDALFGPSEPTQMAAAPSPEPVEAETAIVPDHVPTDWLVELAEEIRRENEARVTFADFAEIEI